MKNRLRRRFTFEQFLQKFYNGEIPQSALAGIPPGLLSKVDNPLEAGDAGWNEVRYGATALAAFFNSKNLIFPRLLPQVMAERQGFRVTTARQTAGVAMAEGGTIGDEGIPTKDTVKKNILEHVTAFGTSTRKLIEAGLADGIPDPRQEQMDDATEAHLYQMNVDLLQTLVDFTTGTDFTTLDAITATNAYCADTESPSAAGENDIYDLDRSVDTWSDSYTDFMDDGTNRVLTTAMMRNLIKNSITNGAQKSSMFIITGYDTLLEIETLLSPLTANVPAWIEQSKRGVTFTYNGVQAAPGAEFDDRVNFFNGVPIFAVPEATIAGDGISRVYCVDTEVTYLEWNIPLIHINNPNLAIVRKLKEQNVLYASADLICEMPNRCGSIRDLAAS